MDEPILRWEVLEYGHHREEPEWFWMLGIIVFSASVAAFLLGDPLFGILLIVGGFTLALYAARGASFTRVDIGKKGVAVNGKFHPYETVDSFSLDGDKLMFEKHAFFHPLIVVPIEEGVPVDELREIFSGKLSEKNHKEPFSHKVMEFLGF